MADVSSPAPPCPSRSPGRDDMHVEARDSRPNIFWYSPGLSDVCLELNFLVCKSKDAGYYDLYLQTGSDTPSGRTCSNYQTIHLPCLC
jgi:hypothetical protein